MSTTEFGTLLTGETYDWSCSNLNVNQRLHIKTKNSSTCPEHCSSHTSCETCLSSQVKYFYYDHLFHIKPCLKLNYSKGRRRRVA